MLGFVQHGWNIYQDKSLNLELIKVSVTMQVIRSALLDPTDQDMLTNKAEIK